MLAVNGNGMVGLFSIENLNKKISFKDVGPGPHKIQEEDNAR